MKAVMIRTVLVLFALFAAPAVAQDPFAEMRAATYPMHNQTASCSAVVIAPGRVLTAAHCVRPGMRLHLKGDQVLDMKLVAMTDEESDLALYSADVGCPCLPIAKSDAVVDEDVFVVGYPMGDQTGFVQFLTSGKAQGLMPSTSKLIITAPTVVGNSGGPAVVVRAGAVSIIGIVSRVYVHEGALIPHMAIAMVASAIRAFLGSV